MAECHQLLEPCILYEGIVSVEALTNPHLNTKNDVGQEKPNESVENSRSRSSSSATQRNSLSHHLGPISTLRCGIKFYFKFECGLSSS